MSAGGTPSGGLHGGTRVRSDWLHTKSEPVAHNGMVVTRHPMAAEAGCLVLEQGGNAVDAAVAASLASSVVMPVANTLGGGGLMVVHDPHRDERATIDYRYEAPGDARQGMFRPEPALRDSLFVAESAEGQANEVGHLAICVPGSVAGLMLAHARWGRLPREDVVAPALTLAREGFEMDWYGTLMAAGHLALLRRFPNTARAFLSRDALPYRPPILGQGDVVRQPALAQTLEETAARGGDAFYTGVIGDEVLAETEAGGGIISREDLSTYRPREGQAIAISYRGFTILGATNAALYRQLIPVLEHLELEGLDPANPGRLHLLIEALRRCRADQDTSYGDEVRDQESRESLLFSHHRAGELADTIDPTRRTDPVLSEASSDVATAREQTMHVSVIDADRMSVSLTETILDNWGSGVTTAGGVLLNNGMSGFTLRDNHPNSVGPRKRPLSNMTPLIVLGPDGSLAASLGASGGPRIVGAVTQVLSNVIDCGLGIQDAIERPRIDVHAGRVLVDSRLGASVASALADYGHNVLVRTESLSTFEFGNPCAVLVGEDGALHGGASQAQITTAVGY